MKTKLPGAHEGATTIGIVAKIGTHATVALTTTTGITIGRTVATTTALESGGVGTK